MEKQQVNADSDLKAARLALFALGASIARSVTLIKDLVRIDSDTEVLSTLDAAKRLSSMPKPLICRSESKDSQLVVSCTDFANASQIDRVVYSSHQKMTVDTGGFMSYITDRYGKGEHLIAAFGRGEALVVPISAVERWDRDYLIRYAGFTGDDVGNVLASSDADYIEARRLGAKGLLRFSSPDDNRSQISGKFLKLPLSATASKEERDSAEKFLIDYAKSSLRILQTEKLSAENSGPAQRNAQFRAWAKRNNEERNAHWKSKLVPDMEDFFRDREIPPETAEFIRAVQAMG